MPAPLDSNSIALAAKAIHQADALLICAGAGIGVDSGLPDFRGDQGFWKAYPTLRESGVSFMDIASPDTFHTDPELAWGFYGHRLNLYRETVPHDGFTLLKKWAEAKRGGHFVFTSNVDGQFQKAGFDRQRITECHGSIHHLQCLHSCTTEIWSAENDGVAVDESTLTAISSLPRCPRCLKLARPNVLMFGDWSWIPGRSQKQEQLLDDWLSRVSRHRGNLAVIEIGAGRAIPTVRYVAERAAAKANGTLIRINPRDALLPAYEKSIGLPFGALDALKQIDTQLTGL